jgi:uncharacterized protein (DUF1697 family)
VRFASFFRNVNVGRPGSPSTAQLLAAFAAAGGADVATFLTHGNVVFTAPDAGAAERVARLAREALERACGLAQPTFTRSLPHLAALVAADPFAGAPTRDVYQQVVSFLPADAAPDLAPPLATARGDVELVRVAGAEAFSVTRKVNGQAGPANAFLERATGARATTRQWSTVVRLVARHG